MDSMGLDISDAISFVIISILLLSFGGCVLIIIYQYGKIQYLQNKVNKLIIIYGLQTIKKEN